MNRKNINEIFTRLCNQNPEPKTELEFVTDYTLLVAIVLSAQATDVGVNKATKSLFEKVKIPEEMLEDIDNLRRISNRSRFIVNLIREPLKKLKEVYYLC